ncbi:unnamed protein product [Cuscuta campestris]|uniref:Uncharacterized protein n=1 Tax=Cuscuta campestris TaxID=132261 RepID=A0A484LB37_9ASTE|nr:unnamed protein product [Cuscuta campestris]
MLLHIENESNLQRNFCRRRCSPLDDFQVRDRAANQKPILDCLFWSRVEGGYSLEGNFKRRWNIIFKRFFSC